MPIRIALNSQTSGKVRHETINGRDHILTQMMPIMGNVAMNRIYYSEDEVKNTFEQLDLLPAPNGHPQVNGTNVSAFHPLAVNSHNIGGFIRSPKMDGQKVFCDFCLDVEVANQSEDGQELIKRMESGAKVGVSTGLTMTHFTNNTGKDQFGAEYDREGHGFKFDHVAILLNEQAAGEHAGTELVLNEGDETPTMVCNLAQDITNELSVDQMRDKLSALVSPAGDNTWAWIVEIFPDSKTFTYKLEAEGEETKLFKQGYAVDQNDELTLLDDRTEGVMSFAPISINNHEVITVDKSKLILAIIANSFNGFGAADQEALEAMTEQELVDALCVETDEAKAKEVLVNSGFDFEAYDNFTANSDAFGEFVTNREAETKSIVDDIVANSEYTAEMLAGKSLDELKILQNMADSEKQPSRLAGGARVQNQSDSASEVAVDYS